MSLLKDGIVIIYKVLGFSEEEAVLRWKKLREPSIRSVQLVGKNTIVFEYSKHHIKLKFDGIESLNGILSVIAEVFFQEGYKEFDVKEHDVIDGGAYVGDTAILFSLMGARHIYCIEPFHSNLVYLKKNLKINKIQNATIIQAALSDKDGIVKLDVPSQISDTAQCIPGKQPVKTVSLDTIVKHIGRNQIRLKLDCEGMEETILKNGINSNIEEIILEVHRGLSIKRLLKHYKFHIVSVQELGKFSSIIHAKR